MKKSSYHNKIQKFIKDGLLENYEITFEKHKNEYDEKTKTYIGPKELIRVLRLNFKHASFFIREPYIEDYINFIKSQEAKEK